LIFSKKNYDLKASLVRSFLIPPYFTYAKSKDEDGKYPKQVSNGKLPMEVWDAIL